MSQALKAVSISQKRPALVLHGRGLTMGSARIRIQQQARADQRGDLVETDAVLGSIAQDHADLLGVGWGYGSVRP